MLAAFLLRIVHDLRPMCAVAFNVAIYWFVGHGLYENCPTIPA